MHLVILPKFNENQISTYNLTLELWMQPHHLDIECDVLTYKRHSCCGKALLVICDFGHEQALR